VGLVNFLASLLVAKIFGIIFPAINAEYQTNLFRSQTDPRMLLFFILPFLVGIILAWFWEKSKNSFGANLQGGIKFGIFYWIIATIPGMFATYTSMPYSFLIVISWLVSGLVEALLAGIILSKLNK